MSNELFIYPNWESNLALSVSFEESSHRDLLYVGTEKNVNGLHVFKKNGILSTIKYHFLTIFFKEKWIEVELSKPDHTGDPLEKIKMLINRDSINKLDLSTKEIFEEIFLDVFPMYVLKKSWQVNFFCK
jgi:hypothetical protein